MKAPLSIVALLGLVLSVVGASSGEGVAPPGSVPASRTDTLWIFDAHFSDTLGDNAGWVSLDMTGTLAHENHWHIDTIRTPLSRPYLGERTWWCGMYNPCWEQPRGYGNDWLQILERAFPEVDANTDPGDQLQLEWDQRYAMERFYDYGYVDVSTNGGSTWTTLLTFTNVGFGGPGLPVNWDHATNGHPVIDAGAYAGQPDLRLRFRFDSDPAYSSQDTPDNPPKHSVKDGAWQLDNITWSKGIPPVPFWIDDCEAGDVMGWVHADTPAAGQTGVRWRRGQYGIDFVTGRPPAPGEPPIGTWMYAAVDSVTSKMVDDEYTWLESPPIHIGGAEHLVARWSAWVDLPEGSRDYLDLWPGSHDDPTCLYSPPGGIVDGGRGASRIGPDWGTWTDNWDVFTGNDWLGMIWSLRGGVPEPGVEHMGGFFLMRFRLGVPVNTGVPEEPEERVVELSVRPVPFHGSTTVRYSLDSEAHVSLAVFDPAGRLVRTLVDGVLPAGEHEAVWEGTTDAGTRAASGVYSLRVEAGGLRDHRKLVLLE